MRCIAIDDPRSPSGQPGGDGEGGFENIGEEPRHCLRFILQVRISQPSV